MEDHFNRAERFRLGKKTWSPLPRTIFQSFAKRPNPLEIKIATSLQRDTDLFQCSPRGRLYMGSTSVLRDTASVNWPD